MTVRKSAAVLAMIAIAVAISACGRKGPLLTPSEAAIEAREEAQDAGSPLPPEPEPVEKDRRFILDGLID